MTGLALAAGRLGVELDRQMIHILEQAEVVEPAALVRCAVDAGIRARAVRLRWKDLVGLAQAGTPTLLLLQDNGAALLDAVSGDQQTLILSNPAVADVGAGEAFDEFRLQGLWTGIAIILRPTRGKAVEDGPITMGALLRDAAIEAKIFREVGLATMVLALLGLAPPLIIMVMVDRVLVYQSFPTLTLLLVMIAIVILHETMLGYAQRALVAVAATRIDGRLSLRVMQRLLRLPQEFFERHRVGEITHSAFSLHRVRDFLTGPLFRSALDMTTVAVLLPVLFWINATLTWVVLGCTMLLLLIIVSFLPALGRAQARVMAAEIAKGSTMYETIAGMRTVKVLALEPRQAEEYNQNTAAALQARLDMARLANWPQTLSTPISQFMSMGLLGLGTWLALNDESGTTAGSLMAFYMMANRVAGPLVAAASLVQQWEDARTAISDAALVMNTRPERPAGQVGLRPDFRGRITFEDVTFRYAGGTNLALDRVGFDIPAGTFVGLVGRSGSGKSTITRLLQGISTGYSGLVKVDGAELREIDLRHLRRNLGVVLQDNFLFRGTIRDNIAAGRPGITLDRIIQACRMAGAEEFIERLPAGYDSFIEEGSPNISGGQRQRLAIARALVVDPAILILDEATSALDPESEALVNANMLRLARGRTMLVVSHRLSALVDADAILVLDRGQVVDMGPHRELLQRCEIYRKLWLQQNRGPSEKLIAHG